MANRDDIHKGGRPAIVRPDGFYENILREYETMTTAQMAALHGVARSTIQRWLKIARTGVDYGKH